MDSSEIAAPRASRSDFFHATNGWDRKERKKLQKRKKRPVENAVSMEIRKQRGFPQRLGKAFGFPTFPTGPTGIYIHG
jgi:hypothetical protein